MSGRTGRGALGAVVVLALLLGAASGARAETLTCQLSAAGSFDPPMWPVGGQGGYAFKSPAGLVNATRCSYQGGPFVDSTIASSGAFHNIACGTATFSSPSAGTGRPASTWAPTAPPR